MKNENLIDNYFSRVKQNPPLMDIEKVHQIITEVEAKTEVEVKKGRRNLLKFTIMTTIFAVILSAVLFWPGNNSKLLENESGSKYQDIQQVSSSEEQDGNAISDGFDKVATVPEKKNNGDENKYIALANLDESDNGIRTDQPHAIVNEIGKTYQPAQQSRQNNIGFNPDTLKPIDGSQFYVEANKEMLEKLGFQFSDSAVYYQNLTPNKKKVSYLFRKERIGDCTIIRTSTLNRYGFLPSVSYTQASYYPVIEAYPSGNIKTTSINKPFDFELANDTLFPIVIRPEFVLNYVLNNIILWFTANDDFLNIIGKKELIPFY